MNIPKLRFKRFTEEWNFFFLKEIATFSKGKNISKNDISSDGNTECIRYGELYTTYSEVISSIKSKTNLDPSTLVFSQYNDIIIPSSGETPIDIATASCVLKDNVALGGDLNIIRTQSNGVFLAFYLNNKKKKDIAQLAQGNSVVHLYNHQLEKLEILLPSLEEQKKIARFFSVINKKLIALKKKKELLEQYKKGVMQKIFSQELRFKDEKGKDFPEWEEKKLGEISFINMGQSPDSKFYNSTKLGLPLIQGNADISKRATVPRIYTTHITKTCEKGDIILTVRAPVGSVAISNQKSCLGRGVCSIKANGIASDKFLYQYFLYYENQWARLEQGSTFTAVNGSDIRNLVIPLPHLSAQNKIADFLSALGDKITLVENQIDQTELWKKGLLQQMFV